MFMRLAQWTVMMVQQNRFENCFYTPEGKETLVVDRTCYNQSPMCLGGPQNPLGCDAMPSFREVFRMERPVLQHCTEWVNEAAPGSAARLRFGDDDCFPMGGDSNIEDGGFFFRGIYAPQVENWLKHFPSDQLLPVSHGLLMKEPRQALAKVYSFMGLEQPEAEPLKQDELDHVIARLYPGFTREGWVFEGHYEKLDSATRDEANALLEPFNIYLRTLLREKFGWTEEEAAYPF